MLIYPKVLFVTNKDDLAIDYLIYNFKDRKIPYLRLNSEDIVEYSITYNFADDIIVIYNDYKYNLGTYIQFTLEGLLQYFLIVKT